jgi:hypothetical protein
MYKTFETLQLFYKILLAYISSIWRKRFHGTKYFFRGQSFVSAGQQIPFFLWNPKFHYLVHNRPSLVPILSQITPVYAFRLFFYMFYFNIILRLT